MTGWMAALWIGLAAVGTIAVLVTAIRGKRLVRSVCTSAVQGVCALAAVNVAGAFTGVSLGLSGFSVACCAIGGLPAAVSLVFLKCIFGI